MRALFDTAEVDTPRKGTSGMAACGACGLHKRADRPRVDWSGGGKEGVLVVTETPGGTDGEYLRDCFGQLGLDLDDDCWTVPAVACQPKSAKGKNREPTPAEVAHCRPRLWQAISTLKPRHILLLGGKAVSAFLSHRWRGGMKELNAISTWRGWVIPDRDVRAWVSPILDPRYVASCLDDKNGQVIERIFKRDLANAMAYVQDAIPFPDFPNEAENVTLLTDPIRIKKYLMALNVRQPELISFDYETTGIKPHARGHEVVCCAIAEDARSATSFVVGQDRQIMRYLRRVLENPFIGKTAHGMKFENEWSRRRIRADVQGWKWCSMNAAHVLDGRTGVTGLKFNTYTWFGVADYDSEVRPFLSGGKEHGANSFNRIHEAPLMKVLLYCGLDSLFGMGLALLQMRLMADPMLAWKGGIHKCVT